MSGPYARCDFMKCWTKVDLSHQAVIAFLSLVVAANPYRLYSMNARYKLTRPCSSTAERVLRGFGEYFNMLVMYFELVILQLG